VNTISITGASGYIGQRLTAWLAREPTVEHILALDIRALPLSSPKVTFIQHDVTHPMDSIFTQQGVQAAVHLAYLVDPIHNRGRERRINVGGTRMFLAACHAARVKTLLIASSATVYGAWPDNPDLLTEEAPLRGKPGFPYVQDKLEQENLAARYVEEHPDCRVLVTRASVVTGPHMNNYLARYLLKSISFAIRGINPSIPLVHENDTVQATSSILQQAPAGAYNLSAPNPVSLRHITQRSGARVLNLPPGLIYLLASLAWKLRWRSLSEAPPAMLDYLRYPWVVDGSKVTRHTDFRYQHDGYAAIEAFLKDRSVGHPAHMRP
jgi:UDP-glucose 4-epimerase